VFRLITKQRISRDGRFKWAYIGTTVNPPSSGQAIPRFHWDAYV